MQVKDEDVVRINREFFPFQIFFESYSPVLPSTCLQFVALNGRSSYERFGEQFGNTNECTLQPDTWDEAGFRDGFSRAVV